jgi:hypothetical protein
LYPNARRLLITADGGGSNGYRQRLWKLELQRLADELGFCGAPAALIHQYKLARRTVDGL